MKFFNEKTMEALSEQMINEQITESELLLINGGLGCSLGCEYKTSVTSTPPYNGWANAASIWGCVNTIFWGGFGLSCTLW